MNRLAVAVALALAWGAARPAVAVTGREVIDTAQKRNGFSTWHDRTGGATMETYEKDTLARTREVDITEQTDPRGEHRTLIEFTGPSDVKGSRVLLHRYERVQNYAMAMESEVANVPEATRTDFKMRDVHYDTGVAPDFFNVATLENGR